MTLYNVGPDLQIKQGFLKRVHFSEENDSVHQPLMIGDKNDQNLNNMLSDFGVGVFGYIFRWVVGFLDVVLMTLQNILFLFASLFKKQEYDQSFFRFRLTKLDVEYVSQLNLINAFVHFVFFVLTLFFSVRNGEGRMKGYTSDIISCWNRVDENEFTITNIVAPSEILSRSTLIKVLLCAFFLLSALFQGYAGLREHGEVFKRNMREDRPQVLRYTEYSLSASCMMVLISLSFGVLEHSILVGIFALTFLCMIIGLFADVFRYVHLKNDKESDIKILLKNFALYAHVTSWFAIILPWVFLGIVYHRFSTSGDVCENVAEVPSFVIIIIIAESLLFLSFGFVQFEQFSAYGLFSFCDAAKDLSKIGPRTEGTFVYLSLVSKVTLGMLILTQVINT
jgi:hypothetical protein